MIIPRAEWFIVAVAFSIGILVFVASYYFVRARRTSSTSWESLVGRLTVLDRDNIAIIASDREFDIEGSRISKMIGGMKGLDALEANCGVLIDLACYVQRYYPEALVVAEELRLNAREIKWHLGRLRGASKAENLQSNFADYAQRAIAIYYNMTCNVLALYERGNLPGLTELQSAI